MAIVLFRIDDRLIHGQVVAGWLKAVPATRVVVVDDATARDAFLAEVLVMAAPPGVEVEVHDVRGGAERARDLMADDEPAYVIVRSPAAALAIREQGVAFTALNVGSMGMAPGRRRVHRSVAASQDELEELRRLEELGVRVVLQAVPEDRAVPLTSLAAAS